MGKGKAGEFIIKHATRAQDIAICLQKKAGF